MNNMISSVLEMGRQEGAQFEKPTNIYLKKYLEQKYHDYKILSSNKHIDIIKKIDISTDVFYISQVTMLNQILQNFMQNAIKFSQRK